MSTTQQKIESVALRLLEKSGAEGVSMRAIAKAVGITPMAIYHHYETREALLDAIVAHEFLSLEEQFVNRALSGSIPEKLCAIVESYLEYAIGHPRLFDYLFAQPRQKARKFPEDFRARKSPTLNRVADLFEEGVAKKVFVTADKWEVAMSLWAHIHGYAMLYRAERFVLSEKQFRSLVRNSLRRHIYALEIQA